MKNIKYLIIALLSLLMVQTSFADDKPKYKGVKVTDKDGKVTTHFHVDSIHVYNDTVTVWNYAMKFNDKVAYEVNYYKPQNVEVYDNPRGLHLFAGGEEVTTSGVSVYLGLEGSAFPDEDMQWCTYAMPYSKKLVAMDDDRNELDVEWAIDNPLYATVSPDGTIMGHIPGDANLTATSLTGETLTIKVHTKAMSHSAGKKLETFSFFTSEGYDRYFDHYYATELGVRNESKCQDFDNKFDYCKKVDVNKSLGSNSSYEYVAIQFDKNYSGNTDNYITNVIAVYSEEPVDVSKPFKIDNREYHYASRVGTKKDQNYPDCNVTDLNNEVGGNTPYIYLAYTKDPYLRPGETEQRYLVSHSALAFYGGEYPGDRILSNNVMDNKNFTRLIMGDKGKVKNAVRDDGQEILNLGSDDEAVKAYIYNLNEDTYTLADNNDSLVDFQYGTNEDKKWITMVCTYEPYCPPANRWMGELDDDTPVNSLSIPGTHDSGTADLYSGVANVVGVASTEGIAGAIAATIIGAPVAGVVAGVVCALTLATAAIGDGELYQGRTQRYGFRDQFYHGVRMFDIRVDGTSHDGNLVHGKGITKAVSNYTNESMLRELKKCLEENKNEFVILDVTIESGCEGTDYSPDQVWEDVKNIVGRGNLIKYKKGLTLNECRGKFLVTGLGSDYITFDASGKMDYYESHRSHDSYAEKHGFVGDKIGKNVSPLWATGMTEVGNINKSETKNSNGKPAIKYGRAAHQLFNYSKLPVDRDTWITTDLSGYLHGADGTSPWDLAIHGKYDSQQASYMNSRIAHFIKGMNGRPCGIVRMDFAGTNYANQDVGSINGHRATTYGYYLCQTVIRNNIVGKKKNVEGKYYASYTIQKDASPTRGSEPVEKCADRTECGWVQLWENGPKFAEYNLGSAIGTYSGMTEYDEATVGGHYTRPTYDNKYDHRTDNASMKWGIHWRTPSPEEMSALLSSDTTEITYCDGEKIKYAPGCTLKGFKISGKGAYAGNSIFLPFAGKVDESGNETGSGIMPYYWGRDRNIPNQVFMEKDEKNSLYFTTIPDSVSQVYDALSLRAVYDENVHGHPKFHDDILADCYEIDDADDLAAFSAFANGDEYDGLCYHPHPTAHAKLTHDIDMSEYDGTNKVWHPIGSYISIYKGHFDGQNHRIKNLHGKALFNAVGSIHPKGQDIPICTIENVIIDSTCVISGDYYVGGLVNSICKTKDTEKEYVCVVIKNCGNEAEVVNNSPVPDGPISQTRGIRTAGILGASAVYSGRKTQNDGWEINTVFNPTSVDVRIINCYNTGKIHGTEDDRSYFGAINSLVSGHLSIYNCWNTGDVQVNKVNKTNKDGSSVPGHPSEFSAAWLGTVEEHPDYQDYRQIINCYSQQDSFLAHEAEHVKQITSGNGGDIINVKTGELCYNLNKNYAYWNDELKPCYKSDTIVWFQNIGDRDFPVFYSQDNDTVYGYDFNNCRGQKKRVYRNEDYVLESELHGFDSNGFCYSQNGQVHYQSANKVDDYYTIANAGNLYWFAKEWNAGNIGKEANIMLVNHIVDNYNVIVDGALANDISKLRKWIPIGNGSHPFKGTVKGNNHVISGLYCNADTCAGLFGYVDNINMESVGVIDSYFKPNVKSDEVGYAGELAGRIENESQVRNCYTTGCVQVESGMSTYSGGLVGYVGFEDTADEQGFGQAFYNCYSVCKVDKVLGDYHYTAPLFGLYPSNVSKLHCYYNSANGRDIGYGMDDTAFIMGVVCDSLNSNNGRVFMSQIIGISNYPIFGGVGNFHIKEAKSEWNSITVPFKVKSNSDIQYYCCTKIIDNTAYIESVDEVEPNTPCFVRNLKYNPEATQKDTLIVMSEEISGVEISENPWILSQKFKWDNSMGTNKELTTVGSLKDINVSEFNGKDGYTYCYYFKNGEIHFANLENVKIPAFRSAFLFKGADNQKYPRLQYITVDDKEIIQTIDDTNKLEDGDTVEAE